MKDTLINIMDNQILIDVYDLDFAIQLERYILSLNPIEIIKEYDDDQFLFNETLRVYFEDDKHTEFFGNLIDKYIDNVIKLENCYNLEV